MKLMNKITRYRPDLARDSTQNIVVKKITNIWKKCKKMAIFQAVLINQRFCKFCKTRCIIPGVWQKLYSKGGARGGNLPKLAADLTKIVTNFINFRENVKKSNEIKKYFPTGGGEGLLVKKNTIQHLKIIPCKSFSAI